MPLYEYHCVACDHRFEVLQRIGEGADGLECPGCGEVKIEKQYSTFASASSGKLDASPALAGGCGRGNFT